MEKSKLTKLEIEYRRFDKISKIVLYGIFVFMIIFGILFVFAKTDETKALFGLFMSLGGLSILFIAPRMAKKRTHFYELLKNEKDSILRTGLFKEVYDEYIHDGFEFNLVYDKLLFQEYFNNSIDICIRKNKHEFLIEINENSISIIVDEESDCPIETDIMLFEILSMEQLYLTINSFIYEHS